MKTRPTTYVYKFIKEKNNNKKTEQINFILLQLKLRWNSNILWFNHNWSWSKVQSPMSPRQKHNLEKVPLSPRGDWDP